MIRFENIEFLYGFGIIPILIIIYILYRLWRKRSLKNLVDSNLIGFVIPAISNTKSSLKFTLFVLSISSLIIALANPQTGSKMEEVKREGIELMIALDLSNSMLAEDITPNRLERAKRDISKLIDRLHSDKIGIVVFAGQAFTQLPITTDYSAAKLFLSTVKTGFIPNQGTAIGAAIELCMEAFDYESETKKAIIIITDGENHEDDAVGIAAEAAEKGITIHTLGMGTLKGAPIPMYSRGRLLGFRKDKQGNSVVSKLNEELLSSIAEAGKGIGIISSNTDSGLDFLLDELNKMEKTEFEAKVYTDYEDQYQYFLALSLFFLLLDLLIAERKNTFINSKTLFGNS